MMAQEEAIIASTRKHKGNVVFNRHGSLLFIGGHGPEDEWSGEAFYIGHVGCELTLEDGYKASRICGEILLSAIHEYVGGFDKVAYLVKAFGLVSCTADFIEHEKVLDGFSDLMVEVLGERGLHARSAMGTSNLPGNIPVEIELIVKLKE